MQQTSKLLFVINPISGGYEKQDIEKGIRNYYKTLPHEIHIIILNGKNDAITIYEKIKTWQPGKVIAVGGDGTIKLVAEQLMGTTVPLGILPAGSLNGLAKELGIPSGVNDALDIITNGASKPVDLVKINDKEICIHLSDIGLNAQLVKYFAMGGVRGKWGYAKAMFRVLLQRQLIKTELYIDENRLVRKVFMIVIANARTYGTGAVINPDGNISDGKFELIIIKELSLWEMFKMLIIDRPFNPDKIEIITAKEAVIKVPKRAYFQVDGEFRGKMPVVQARILPAALQLIVP